jgi:hypothetical protein
LQYVSYDEKDHVLFADYTNMHITSEIFSQVIEEIQLLATRLDKPVCFLACLANTTVAPELTQDWGKYTKQALQYVLGVIRYQANNVMTNVTIRTNTVRDHLQGVQSHIYPDRTTALAAIRQIELAAAAHKKTTG